MPKIVYVTNARLPTEKAHGLATIKLCEAFVGQGYEVDIVSPLLWRRFSQNIFDYYGVKKTFIAKNIFTIDLMPLGIWKPLAFLIQIFSFSLCALPCLLYAYRKNFDKIIFFSHDYMPLYFLTFFSKRIFYDIHDFPQANFLCKRVLKKAFGFSVQTKWKINALKEKFGISPEKIVYWPNGTDVEKFKLKITQAEAREKLNLSQDKKIVLYTGQLFDWKGVDTLLEAAVLLPPTAVVYIVGGAEEDVVKLKKEVPGARDKDVVFIPFQPHDKIPLWLKAADVLILPNTGKQKISQYYTSPMKLFEYMASGQPIVASAIPSIQEILNDKNALLAEADNPDSFAEKINYVFNHPNVAVVLGRQAQLDVRQYTWENRAKKIGVKVFQ